MEDRLPKYFFQEIWSCGGKQTIHKVSATFIVKNCHPRTSLKFHLLYFVSMTFSNSLYVSSRFCQCIYEPLSFNKQLILQIFSIFLTTFTLISYDQTWSQRENVIDTEQNKWNFDSLNFIELSSE